MPRSRLRRDCGGVVVGVGESLATASWNCSLQLGVVVAACPWPLLMLRQVRDLDAERGRNGDKNGMAK